MASTYILSDNGVSSGSAGLKETGGTDGTLVLQTTTSGGTATNALTIDNSQNVGIGTSSPSYKLDVNGVGNFQGVQVGTNGDSIRRSGDLYTVADGAYSLIFQTNGVNRATIDSSGNVGIGVTPSANSLSVNYLKNISFQYTAASNYANIFNQENSAALVLASGMQRSATANGFASSYGGSWAKSAVSVGYGFVKIYADAATTVAVGTDVTPTEKIRVLSNGEFTKYDNNTNTYVRDFGWYYAANTYLHIKFNTKYDSNKMIGWRLYGYQAYNIFIDTYYGCYLYVSSPSTPYGSIVRDAGSASGGAMYYSTDGYLCISCAINGNGYTGLRLESLVNGGDYGGGIDVAVLAYKGYATNTGAY